ncbi:hypothetical protein ACWFRJ_39990 [Streptomyces sp. NPDC055239]
MSPALRKRPICLACAAVIPGSAHQRPEPDHTILAPSNRRPRLVSGGSR